MDRRNSSLIAVCVLLLLGSVVHPVFAQETSRTKRTGSVISTGRNISPAGPTVAGTRPKAAVATVGAAQADRYHSSVLTADQLQRVESSRRLLDGVDGKTPAQVIAELEKSAQLDADIQILEAMARTYDEIVQEQKVVEPKKKEWLYSMVKLNMAYLQLGGIDLNQVHDSGLNFLIRRKLREYLPTELKQDTTVFHPLE